MPKSLLKNAGKLLLLKSEKKKEQINLLTDYDATLVNNKYIVKCYNIQHYQDINMSLFTELKEVINNSNQKVKIVYPEG